ncbi:hypothetical protein [Fluviicola chungangensis]|uniref:Ig-like domain-containing protein n=1 Tax=Fluviicola chungangensis TaxID=2597671 RepID=A0A556MPM7_9FLAO|nr:hypothetical protein [Fluviicola chungangensis]TSJ41880.1 hypothetical protein FO442_12370 [Fluviicola chungangensis]
MKRSLTLPMALIGLFLGVFAFNACQKETKETFSSVKNGKEDPAQVDTKTCVHPVFCNKQVDAACSDGYSCALAIFPSTNRNRIRWHVGTQCSCSQSYSSTVYYTLYKWTSSTPPQYTKVATFSCNNATMWYAKTLLTNSTVFNLLMNETSVIHPTTITEDSFGFLYDTGGTPLNYNDNWKFTTGSTAGTISCVVKDPGGLQ